MSRIRAEAGSAYGVVTTAIARQRCVVLDGGIATELSHQHGQDHEHLWGMEALASSPEEVRDVHRCYVEAGADVITTNTWSLPTVIDGDGSISRSHQRPLHWMDVARRGIQMARDAIDDGRRSGECAVAFSLNGDLDGPEGQETVSLLARTLASEPPDLVLFRDALGPAPVSVRGRRGAAGDRPPAVAVVPAVPAWASVAKAFDDLLRD